jgi:hypothetical protein
VALERVCVGAGVRMVTQALERVWRDRDSGRVGVGGRKWARGGTEREQDRGGT